MRTAAELKEWWAEWGGVCPIYFQIGYYPTAGLDSEERGRVWVSFERLLAELERWGLHPKRWEFRGNADYHSAFVYLADEQPDWASVKAVIDTADRAIVKVFGEGIPRRCRHRFWTY